MILDDIFSTSILKYLVFFFSYYCKNYVFRDVIKKKKIDSFPMVPKQSQVLPL